MDTLMGSRTWKWREVDWTAAAVAGFAAGAVLMVLDLLWSAFFSPEGPWRTSHMIAPIFTGTGAPRATGYAFSVAVVAISLATHYALGVVFGLVMAALLVEFRLDATLARALMAGAVMGALLYLVNFELLVGLFPWLAALRGADTFAAHVVFGMVTVFFYRRLKRTPTEP